MNSFTIALSFVLTMQTAVPRSNGTDYISKIADSAQMVLNLFYNGASFGREMWEKMGAGQGKSILEDVRSQATDLHTKNMKLKADLEESRRHKTEAQFPITQRIAELNAQIAAISTQMLKFGKEIDRTSTEADRGRQVIIEEADAKASKLGSVEENWHSGWYYEAMEQLDVATANLETMQKATKCLLRSIDLKEVACDAKLNPLSKKQQ